MDVLETERRGPTACAKRLAASGEDDDPAGGIFFQLFE